ncbi:MAG: fimbrillin family protein [Muribaculaceae bacterium]|nr:fimbrillin family protein [Muribaculaceae bacterium]
MNLKKIYILLNVALCLLGGLAVSCTQDDLEDGSGTLPPGKYPLRLTASIEASVSSRSACKDEWDEGDVIAVRIGDYPVTGSYMLNADGTVKKSVNALSWLQPEDYVTAWYPYVYHEETLVKKLTDQTDGLANYDLLGAQTDKKHYKETVDLKFQHRMSKVICRLLPGEGVSDEEFATVALSVNGYSEAKFNQGIVTAGDVNEWIKPFFDAEVSTSKAAVFEALVVPQDMAGKDMFKVNIDVNVNGHIIPKTLTYKADESSGKLDAGYYSIYTIVVQKDRLMVNPPVSAEWNDVGGAVDSAPWVFKIVFNENFSIPKKSRKEIVFSPNIVNLDAFMDSTVNYLEVAGNEFSFSYTILDNEKTPKMEFLDGVKDVDILESGYEVDGNKEIFTFSGRMRSNEVTAVYKEFYSPDPKPGDFYYDDGTWSTNKQEGKTCVGIVFHALKYDWWLEDAMQIALDAVNDDGAYDLDEFIDKSVHGYALALEDANSSKTVKWNNVNYECGLTASSFRDSGKKYFNGYSNMETLKALRGTVVGKNVLELPPVEACLDYNVPTSHSSGWYLPSADQLVALIANKAAVQNGLVKAGGVDLVVGTGLAAAYWSSNEGLANTSLQAYALFNWHNASPSVAPKLKGNAGRVRAILTF